jgi:transcriptional regulator with XRE-family HTH domain
MTPEQNPVGSSHLLRRELRRLRLAAGMTQNAAAVELDWSQSKIVRIESGAVGVSTTDLRAILALYGVTDAAKIDEMVRWGRSRRLHAWWDDYGLLDQHFKTFLGLEAAAQRIRQFQSSVVPGPLQTEEYAEAAISGFDGDLALIRQGVDARLRRQLHLFGPDGPEMYFVMDEAALRRIVGSVKTMGDQLRKLIERAQRPNVHMHVVPFDYGYYAGAHGSFVTLEFGDDGPDPVALLEQPRRDDLIQNDRPAVDDYLSTFDELQRKATKESDFSEFVENILRQEPYARAVA